MAGNNRHYVAGKLTEIEDQLGKIRRTLIVQGSMFPVDRRHLDWGDWMKHAGPVRFVGIRGLAEEISTANLAFQSIDPWLAGDNLAKRMGNMTDYKQRIAAAAEEAQHTFAVQQFKGWFRFAPQFLLPWSSEPESNHILCTLHEKVYRETHNIALPLRMFHYDVNDNKNLGDRIAHVAHNVLSSKAYTIHNLRGKGSKEKMSLAQLAGHHAPSHDVSLLAKQNITLSQTTLLKTILLFQKADHRRRNGYSIILTNLVQVLDRLRLQQWRSVWQLRENNCAFYRDHEEQIGLHIAMVERSYPGVTEIWGAELTSRIEPLVVVAAGDFWL